MNTRYRIATTEEIAQILATPAHRRAERVRALARLGVLVPIMGGDGEGGSGGDGGGSGGSGGDGGSGDGGSGGDGGGDGGSGDGGDGGDETVPKSELDKAQQAAASKDRELRELKKANEDRERKEREAGGKFDELYKAERDKNAELQKELDAKDREIDELKSKGKESTARGFALDALRDAHAKKATTAVRQLDLDKITSESAAKRAVEQLKKDEPYMFDDAPTRQVRDGGDKDRDGNSRTDNDDEPIGPARLRRAFSESGKKD